MAKRRRRHYRIKRRRRRSRSPVLLAGLVVLVVFISLAFLAGKRFGSGGYLRSVKRDVVQHEKKPFLTEDATSQKSFLPPDFPSELSPDFPDYTYNKVAIVIDDLGANLKTAKAFIALDPSLTLAVIPWEHYSEAIVSEAVVQGVEVILHQPMEAHNYTGRRMRGMLYLNMSDSKLRRTLKETLLAYPGIEGINNHMGSAFTENRHAMQVVADVLAEYGLYFLDSMTTNLSVAYQVAESAGLYTYRRDVFLDNQADYGYMKGMWDSFIRTAKQEGTAVLIAHDRKKSMDFLRRRLSDLDREDLLLVPLSSLPRN